MGIQQYSFANKWWPQTTTQAIKRTIRALFVSCTFGTIGWNTAVRVAIAMLGREYASVRIADRMNCP